jgi:hypothetical protein
VRAEDPSATFSVFGTEPADIFVAGDQERSDPGRHQLDARLDRHPRDVQAVAGLRRIPGPQVVYFYGGVGRPDLPKVRERILRRLHDPTCRPVPIYGLVVVSCP